MKNLASRTENSDDVDRSHAEPSDAPLPPADPKDRKIEELKKQNEELSRVREELSQSLQGILNSKSWRFTLPLRKAAVLVRNLFPLFRFSNHHMNVSTFRDFSREGDLYRATGTSPSLILKSNREKEPEGWITMAADLKAAESHIHFFLYYRTGDGYEGGKRALIPFVTGEREYRAVRLPMGVKELRLDPCTSDAEFSLKNIEIREIGNLQALYLGVRRQLRGGLSNPGLALNKLKKAWSIFRQGGFIALKLKLFSSENAADYQDWVRRYDTLTDKDRDAIRKLQSGFSRSPLISIVMPVYNTPERWLRAAIESVRNQLYESWELCIADDASTRPEVRGVLEEYAKKDSRIKVVFREKNGHISAASNSAFGLAKGEFVALLDHDDELTEHALSMVVHEINSHPDAALIYSDEDKKTSLGMRMLPFFKPDWNPDLFLSQNYLCHLLVIKTEVMRKVSGFREDFEGAQDWDLGLRVVDSIREEQVRHIPHVLYHWRIIEGSTAESSSYKPYIFKSQAKAVAEHLERKGVRGADVQVLNDIAQLRIHFPIPANAPLVSLIIPTHNQGKLLKRCVDSIFAKTTYKNFEVIVVDNRSDDRETLDYLDTLKTREKVKVVKDDAPFNFSRINNQAAKAASGEIFGFLNNDLEVISKEWLHEMVSHALRPEIGIVGARLYYPNGLLQHGGVILGIGGVAGHSHKGRLREEVGYFNRIVLPHNLSAVTAACAVMRKEVFHRVGGFDEGDFAVAFNDVDLCLRVRKAGLRVLYTPYAEFYHFESASRGYETTPDKFARFEGEIAAMKRRWGGLLENDPYYNPNLTLLSEDFSLAFPPRAPKPWRAL